MLHCNDFRSMPLNFSIDFRPTLDPFIEQRLPIKLANFICVKTDEPVLIYYCIIFVCYCSGLLIT